MSVKLSVYDVLGKEVATLVNEHQRPGLYQFQWNAAGHASGLHFYKLSTNDYTIVKKMLLLK